MSDQPIDKLRLGAITLTIWRNTSESGAIFYATTILRAYRTQEGWKDTASFQPRDLPVVTRLCDLASKRIMELQAEDRAAARDAELQFAGRNAA